MKKNEPFAADELITSPMTHVALRLPKVLVDRIDAAAAVDDPSSPNRSSLVRRFIVQGLRRQVEAA
ncbi:hypothetical protein HAP47_0005335 [Bradyrhizobium sp. 41S5]|uniref:hypothetical protein n=1 Tax=Bradyrhizobium sp. 41S5 TaxID=1404443 RepID=UPI00156A9A22|nr:hypothetical protein [Bradyrhizobium sp. 41S5]UFX46135.1 hypothetical protein HAP47_0005335 [Bradyrhizobium sp. 41S5]